MEMIQHFETKPVLCRQHSKSNEEDDLSWLGDAELLARLAENARRLRSVLSFLSERVC
jgi:hypothetical protein